MVTKINDTNLKAMNIDLSVIMQKCKNIIKIQLTAFLSETVLTPILNTIPPSLNLKDATFNLHLTQLLESLSKEIKYIVFTEIKNKNENSIVATHFSIDSLLSNRNFNLWLDKTLEIAIKTNIESHIKKLMLELKSVNIYPSNLFDDISSYLEEKNDWYYLIELTLAKGEDTEPVPLSKKPTKSARSTLSACGSMCNQVAEEREIEEGKAIPGFFNSKLITVLAKKPAPAPAFDEIDQDTRCIDARTKLN